MVRIIRMFQSHAGIEHFRVDWNNNPLLLFADMHAKEYAQVWTYQQTKTVTTTRQNVTRETLLLPRLKSKKVLTTKIDFPTTAISKNVHD